jgi:hypothetical protein
MSSKIVRSPICFHLNYATGRVALGGARHQQFANTLASDDKDRLCVEITWELQTIFSGLLSAFG